MKKVPETDAIFERLAVVNPAADAQENVLRLSVDAKATIPLGLFSRGGYSRLTVKALDHDFAPDKKVTPVGVFLPQRIDCAIKGTIVKKVRILEFFLVALDRAE